MPAIKVARKQKSLKGEVSLRSHSCTPPLPCINRHVSVPYQFPRNVETCLLSAQSSAVGFEQYISYDCSTRAHAILLRHLQDSAVVAFPMHLPNIKTNVHIFAIFDGHGGKGASMLCKRNLLKELLPRLPNQQLPPESDVVAFQARFWFAMQGWECYILKMWRNSL